MPSPLSPLLALEGVVLAVPGSPDGIRSRDWSLPRGGKRSLQGMRAGEATALLRLLCGLEAPLSGRVLLEGTPLARGASHPFLERGALGYVPSDGGLAVNLSLEDNVALPLRFALNQDRASARASARLWLERAGLSALAPQRPPVPANGDCWLASLARAAARAPRLWLVDRPGPGLDAQGIRAARNLLEEAARDPEVSMVLAGEPWMAPLGGPLRLEGGRILDEGGTHGS